MRYYDTPGGKFPSVTSILGEVVPMPWFPNYMKKWAREALWEMVNAVHINYKTEYQKTHANDKDCSIVIPLIEISDIQYCLDAHKRHSEKAMGIGSLVHSAIETYCKEWDKEQGHAVELYLDLLKCYYPEIEKIIDTFFTALEENNVWIKQSEQTVWHPMGYAGTLDLICEMDGKLWIGDIKTFESKEYKSGKPKKPLFKKEHYAQLEAYRRAYNNEITGGGIFFGNTIQTIENRFILWLDKRDQSNYYLELIDEKDNDKHWDMFVKAYEMFKAWK
jgi:hypothetical protein